MPVSGSDVSPEADTLRESSALSRTSAERGISYGGYMTTTTVTPGPTVHGGTALGARPDHSRHLLGSTLRAVRVFARTAVDVVLLGSEGKRY